MFSVSFLSVFIWTNAGDHRQVDMRKIRWINIQDDISRDRIRINIGKRSDAGCRRQWRTVS